MEEHLSVRVSYHRQKSSTGRIRGGQIHLRISNLISRREQERHIQELTEKMMEAWGELGDSRERVSLEEVFGESLESFGSFGDESAGGRLRIEEKDEDQGIRKSVGVWPGLLRMSTGVQYEVKVRKVQRMSAKVQKIGSILHVLWPIDQKFCSKKAAEALWQFLMKDQVPVLVVYLDELREGWIEERFSQVKLKQVMSRWGSCDKGEGVIMLSVKLLFMDRKLLEYVCVHELAHLRHANHGDLFWDLVERKMPDWKVQRKRLRNFE